MAADDFFRRWTKPKTALPEVLAGPPDLASSTPQEFQAAGAAQDKQLPTLDDVAKLGRDSDYSPFLAKGVDEAVKRSAMKKLFSDPRFNLMDGLDTYIDDYNKFEPIPPEMLALLNHAKALLNPLAQFEKPAIEATPPETDENCTTTHDWNTPSLPSPAPRRKYPWGASGRGAGGEGGCPSETVSSNSEPVLSESETTPCRAPSPPTPLPPAGEGSKGASASLNVVHQTDPAKNK